MRIRHILSGLASYVPGHQHLRRGTGGTTDASYCYGVWLKHLTLAAANGLRDVPTSVAEIGPGDSLGTGIAALLCGAQRYDALDVVRYARQQRNVDILEQLARLFRDRAPYPGRDPGWPSVARYLDSQGFPSAVLAKARLNDSLRPERVEAIRDAILGNPHSDLRVRYVVPWAASAANTVEPVDFLFSHSLLEHVDDLAGTYRSMYVRLRSGGMMSHQIDFTSHGLTPDWNGYWGVSKRVWQVVRGRRAFLINRQPVSAHLECLEQAGFRIVCELRQTEGSGLARARLAPEWRHLSNEDLRCRGLFVQAVKD